MTLLIDGYTITGTPEEINTFMKIYKQNDANINVNHTSYILQPFMQTCDLSFSEIEGHGTETAITTETF